ncbi:YdcP family protein [Clostridioides difficile]|uniref:YdcP family protein n=1 Tax=Clostridioides difficile TaxID=1496 RepID=UPI000BCC554B|nr:YdcP family protein [Clostridioides difficile]MCA0549296.1 YdcP family protein [Clostridioides difficile]PBE35877.1 conjugal transfer protein [Clostridioides difficile]
MRLANGIVLDNEKTFGVLKFSALRHEVRVENEDGTTSDEIKRRTYDLKCSVQERMIQVSIPADVPVKDFPYNAEVELINPVADMVANANFRGADVDWYIKADDIILKNKGNQPAGNPQNNNPQNLAPQGQQKNKLAN